MGFSGARIAGRGVGMCAFSFVAMYGANATAALSRDGQMSVLWGRYGADGFDVFLIEMCRILGSTGILVGSGVLRSTWTIFAGMKVL